MIMLLTIVSPVSFSILSECNTTSMQSLTHNALYHSTWYEGGGSLRWGKGEPAISYYLNVGIFCLSLIRESVDSLCKDGTDVAG